MGPPARDRCCGVDARHRLYVLIVVGVATALLAALTVGPPAAGRPHEAAQTFRLDHFLCYSAESAVAFNPRRVRLADQFGRRTAEVVRPAMLCNPVRKNAGTIRNPGGHLVCYQARARPSVPSRTVTAQNQFGRSRLRTAGLTTLCLPSGKSERPDEPITTPETLDHYACYLVRPVTRFRVRRVGLFDQFGDASAQVIRPATLCNPASKNAGRILNRRDHLVCHSIRFENAFQPRRVVVANQFTDRAELTAVRPLMLCLPSVKRV